MLKKDRLACEIATLVHNKYLMTAYGIKDCNINFTVGDIREKIINKTILDDGYDCNMFPKCHPDKHELENIAKDLHFTTFPTPPPIPTVIIQKPVINNITNQTIVTGNKGSFEFTQNTPSNVWIINHMLGFNPNITVLDFNGNTVEGDIAYTVDGQQLILTFTDSITGKAFLS